MGLPHIYGSQCVPMGLPHIHGSQRVPMGLPHIYGSQYVPMGPTSMGPPHTYGSHTPEIALESFLFPPPPKFTQNWGKNTQKNPTKYPKVQKWPQIRHPDNNVGLCPTSGGLSPPKWGSVPHSSKLSPKVGLCAPPMCGSVPHSTELSP